MELNDRYVKRDPDCAFRIIDNLALVVKISQGDGNKVFSLNKTGTVIWQYADGTHSVAQIVSLIKDEFDVDKEIELEAEVIDFTEELIKRNLLQGNKGPF